MIISALYAEIMLSICRIFKPISAFIAEIRVAILRNIDACLRGLSYAPAPKHEVARFEFKYDYCKGCAMCVTECSCGAIEMLPEQICTVVFPESVKFQHGLRYPVAIPR